MKTTLTAEQQISQAKVSLMNSVEFRWMAGILMMGDTKFVSGKDAKGSNTKVICGCHST